MQHWFYGDYGFADFWSSTHWFKLWKKWKVAETKRSGHPDRHKSSWRNILGDRTCPGCSIHLNDYLSSTSHKSRQNGETSPSKWATDHATESHHTTENATWSIGRDIWVSFLRVMIHGSKNSYQPYFTIVHLHTQLIVELHSNIATATICHHISEKKVLLSLSKSQALLVKSQ